MSFSVDGWVSVYEDVTAQHRLESELRVQIERLDRAMSNMSHGLCLFGPDERLIMCNAQYRRIYGLDAGVVKPGISYRDILAHGVELGNHGDLSVDELYARRIEIPTPRNPLCAKGIGQGGAVGATPAVQNAVIDAVSHLGVRHIDMPCTPEKVWRSIAAGRAAVGRRVH